MRLYSRLLFAFMLILISPALLPAQQSDLSPEVSQLLSQTNRDRAAHGLRPLRWSQELADAAQAHDELMVQHNDLQHQFSGEADLPTRAGQAGAHFHAVAENIALGPDVGDLERQWMHSTLHRANILDAEMDIIGIALIRNRGEVWAVVDFAHAVEAFGPAEVEGRVIGLLAQQGMPNATATPEARETCKMDHGSAGAKRPLFIMRWEGSDLNRLPDVLVSKLESGRYRLATVGVCGNAQPGQGFTTYKVAVLLY